MIIVSCLHFAIGIAISAICLLAANAFVFLDGVSVILTYPTLLFSLIIFGDITYFFVAYLYRQLLDVVLDYYNSDFYGYVFIKYSFLACAFSSFVLFCSKVF